MPAILPPWLVAADPASQAQAGLRLGSGIGAEQASQLYQQQQQLMQQARQAEEQRQFQLQYQLQQAQQQREAEKAARIYAAQQGYQKDIEAGADPLKAILKWGPMMGQQASPEAAALRAEASRRQPMPGQAQIPQGMVAVPTDAGGWHIVPNPKQPRSWAFVPANKDTGEPAHWEDTQTGEPKSVVHDPGMTEATKLSKQIQLQRLISEFTSKSMFPNLEGMDEPLAQWTPEKKKAFKEAKATLNKYKDMLTRLESGEDVSGGPSAANPLNISVVPGATQPVGAPTSSAPLSIPRTAPAPSPVPVAAPPAPPRPVLPPSLQGSTNSPMPAAAPVLPPGLPQFAMRGLGAVAPPPPPAPTLPPAPVQAPPAQPEITNWHIQPTHPKTNADVENMGIRNRTAVPKLNDDQLLELAYQVGVEDRQFKDSVKPWNQPGVNWRATSSGTRKKMERKIIEALNDSQQAVYY